MKNSYEIRGDVTALFLNRKDGSVLETLIDTKDLNKADEFPYTWCPSQTSTGTMYACGRDYENSKTLRLHRYISQNVDGMDIDHINGNTLDNRSENLRIVTHQQNMQNVRVRKDSASGHRGVYFDKSRNQYEAYVRIEGFKNHLGRFDTMEEAIEITRNFRLLHMPYSLRE